MTLVWSDRAQQDLFLIKDYIGQDSPVTAQKFIEKLVDSTGILASAPKTGRKVPEINVDDIRELIVGNYRIVYTILENQINILTVFEGHKKFQ
jgi:toxin ParE1/3/4